MPAPDELSAALDRLEAPAAAKEVGRNSQVGATADLDKMTGEIKPAVPAAKPAA